MEGEMTERHLQYFILGLTLIPKFAHWFTNRFQNFGC